MSLTAIAWLGMVLLLALMAQVRASYGFAVYLLTFFIFPAFWWWGRPLPNLRWNLFAGIVFLVAVLLQSLRTSGQDAGPEAAPDTQIDAEVKRLGYIAVALAANATLVHVLLAPSWAISADNYIRLLKFVALFFVVIVSIRTPKDLRIVLWAIVLCAAYIGYEVTINDRGRIIRGRLEGVGAAGVTDANGLACLMVTVLPLAGGLFFWGKRSDKLLVALAGPLILNVVLLCSSRGALLALVAGACAFLLYAPAAVRRKASMGLALAGVASVLLLGNPKIIERFGTTFTDEESRDGSAAGRLVLWRAGLRFVADHPLGVGGGGFKGGLAASYLAGVGVDRRGRSVHSGILNEACEWGVQGLAMRALFLGFAVLLTRRTLRQLAARGAPYESAFGCCLIAAVVTFVVSSGFGDYLDEEWGYWVPAIMIAYARMYGRAVPATARLADEQIPAPTAVRLQTRTAAARM